MDKLILFYKGNLDVNGYFFDDIINRWTDYQLEIDDTYIHWLFPSSEKSQSRYPVLSKTDINLFKTDADLKSKVINATIRMLYFYGYEIIPGKWVVNRIKTLRQKEEGALIGLYSIQNYDRITKIMTFLNEIEMSFLSGLFFLAMCESMRSDEQLRQQIEESGYIPIWMSTQPFLRTYMDGYDPNRLKFSTEWGVEDDDDDDDDDGDGDDDDDDEYDYVEEEEEDTAYVDDGEDVDHDGEADSEEEVYYENPWDLDNQSKSDDEESESDIEQDCLQFQGLQNIGNSCYMDSTLLPLLAIPNNVITREILNKDVKQISESRSQWITCSNNRRQDYKYRYDIQEQLIRIARSMRKQDTIKRCSTLRKAISKCPGPQAFHDTDQQDSGEFLAYLFNLFQVDIATKSTTTYVTNEMTEHPRWLEIGSNVDNRASPIVSVSSYSILENREYMMNEFMVHVDDVVFTDDNLYKHETGMYMRKRSVDRIIDSPYIVFSINRTHYDITGEVKLKTSIVPVQRIGNLNLHAIVVHQGSEKGGHYTAYIKCNGVWFFYDDVPNTIRRIGSYDRMLQATPSVKTDGVQYFYN